MAAALRGDQGAYRLLLNDLRLWMTAYYVKRVHRNNVEDLVQDTLMTVHNKRQTYDTARPLGPWVAAIARHRWIDHMRTTLKYVETPIDDDFPAEEPAKDESAKHDIKILLQLIPSPQAQVIEMVKLKEMSIEETAKATGHSPSSVKVMIHRGMKKMMRSVQEAQDD